MSFRKFFLNATEKHLDTGIPMSTEWISIVQNSWTTLWIETCKSYLCLPKRLGASVMMLLDVFLLGSFSRDA